MPFIGLMCVKNEERWLGRALESLYPVCDWLAVLDDGSTDRTKDIICTNPFPHALNLYVKSPFTDRDEARDKTYLLGIVTDILKPPYIEDDEHPWPKVGSDTKYWAIYLDGDEELVAQDREKLLDTVNHHVDQYCVQILYLWGDEETVRVDGHYGKCYRPSVFRLVKHGMTYQNHSGEIHATGVPREIGYSVRLHEPEPVRVLHYGYMEKEERERKFERYMQLDPAQEEFYRRECFGPAETKRLSEVLA